MTVMQDNYGRWAVSGSYQPLRYWWQGGKVNLHLTTGTWQKLLSIVPQSLQNLLSVSSGQIAVTDFHGLFVLFDVLYQQNLPIDLDNDLQLLGRVWRLALEIVREQDFLPFISSSSLETKNMISELIRTTESMEEDWLHASGLTSHRAMWVPGFKDSYLCALRRLYIDVARAVLGSSWQSSFPWDRSHHAQMMVDLWLCFCVDEAVRGFQVETVQAPSGERGVGGARLPYRGEAELLSSWRRQLTADVREPFEVDRWLAWRMLKKIFAQSGWRQSNILDDSGAETWHIEMELIPPSGDQSGGDWDLMYFLAHNYWAKRVDLREWWQHTQRWMQVGEEYLIEPDRWFLPILKRAGEVSQPVARSLKQQAPSCALVAPDELLTFLYEELPQLHRLGIVVKSPQIESVDSKDVRIRVQVKKTRTAVHKQAQGKVGSESWFDAKQLVDFDWSLVIGDKTISKEQFQQMVEDKSPYIHLNGTWRLVPMQEILKQLQTFEALSQYNRGTELLQFSRVLALDEANAVNVDIDYTEDAVPAKRWIEALKQATEPPLLAAPQAFHGTLRQYQEKGYAWLIHLRNLGLGGCLADDMGLGKTIQVLAYFMYLKENNLQKGTHLLICPTSLLQNWRSELHRFTPELTVYIHHGTQRNNPLSNGELPLMAAIRNTDVIMTTYATLVRDIDSLMQIQWDAVVADEAQNVKNTETKQAGAIRKLPVTHAIALTGTPVENRLEELWSIMDFVNPGYLGNLSWFRREFAVRIQQEPSGLTAKRLQLMLQPVLLRRRKIDASIQVELPEKWEVREYAGLTTEQAAVYQSIVNRLWTGISAASEMSRKGQILAALVRLKQVCDHPCLVTGGNSQTTRSAKLKMLLDLIEDVTEEEDSCLVFTQFRDMGELICDAAEARFGWRPQFLHGGLSASMRGEIVSRFQDGTDKAPMLVLSLKAGGVGLNLTRANHVFHFDRWWNPAVEDQATDRAFRIGQTKDVQVHKLVCSGTLEERIDELITAKRALSSAIVGESEAWLTEMDDSELRSLFALDAQAAVEVEE